MVAMDTLWTGLSGVILGILIALACIKIILGRRG